MGDLTLFNSGKLPSYIKNIGVDDVTKKLLTGGGGIPRISIRGGVFRKIVGGEEISRSDARAMNIVVLDSSPTQYRTFYMKQYKEGQKSSPDCWSADGKHPSPEAKHPQHSDCANCPQNRKGSGQGDSRACRFSQQLAVLLDGDLEGDILQLTLPSQSIFGKEGKKLGLLKYVEALQHYGVPITAVVTEMRFDVDSATPKLIFSPVRPLEEDEYTLCRKRAEEDAVKKAIELSVYVSTLQEEEGDGEDEEFESKIKPKKVVKDDEDDKPVRKKDVEDDEDDEPPVRKRAKKVVEDDEDDEPKPKKAKKVVVDDDEDDEPVVRSGKKKQLDAKSILAAWDDEDDE